MKKKYKILALIPARSGSKRLRNKNILCLNRKPLIAITIISAKKSKLFDKIILSTDKKKYALIGKKYGAEVPFLRPSKFSTSSSPDYEWVKFTINKLEKLNLKFTHFFILRPTNPFRTEKTILRAWKKFQISKADSLRAISICEGHPYKMWKLKGNYIRPLFKKNIKSQPAFNCPYQTLPKIYSQNASLEISKTNVLKKNKTITGKKIIPFFSNRIESIDINYKEDFIKAKKIIKNEFET
jgi:CMP-N,N'-diacetyllegionaminic acid synthase